MPASAAHCMAVKVSPSGQLLWSQHSKLGLGPPAILASLIGLDTEGWSCGQNSAGPGCPLRSGVQFRGSVCLLSSNASSFLTALGC